MKKKLYQYVCHPRNKIVPAILMVYANISNVGAAVISHTFNAQVTLISQCRIKTGASTLLDFGSYTAFQTSDQNATLNVDFECTRGFSAAPQVEFDSGADKTTSATGSTATGEGVIAGLKYSLSVSAGTKTAGNPATTSSIGTPDVYRYIVNGSITALQAGDTSSPSTQVRNLKITY